MEAENALKRLRLGSVSPYGVRRQHWKESIDTLERTIERSLNWEEYDRRWREALNTLLDESTERWHTTLGTGMELHEWLGLSFKEYGKFIARGADGYVDAIADRELGE